MASEILVNIQEEVTCPICLDLLTEPLSLDCGHSFCQACITVNKKESMIKNQEKSNCPMCKISYQPEHLRPNRHLANIVERLRYIKVNPEEKQKRNHCVHHGEKLQLFCQQDGKVICLLCEHSQEHRGHQTFLIEEVAHEYQGKLQAVLEKMTKKEQEIEELETDIRKKETSWKHQIESEVQNIQAKFEQMRRSLDSEEKRELQKLKNEEEVILHNLAEAENELVQQRELLNDLISDLKHRLQGSAVEMLQDVNAIMKRSETLTLKKPSIFPMKIKKEFQTPGLLSELMCKELTDARHYWVDVTLDRPNNKPSVEISADGKQVRCILSWYQKNTYLICSFDDFGVVGSKAIISGKYYWEVDVSKKHAWILGVCDRRTRVFNEKCIISQDNIMHNKYIYSMYQPKYGFWVIGLQNQSEYNAFEDSSASEPNILKLTMAVPPHRVGVFLDYEAGTVAFYNVTNSGILIYKFSFQKFSQKTFPYLNPLNCNAPMILCSPSS